MRIVAASHHIPEERVSVSECVAAAGGTRIESLAFERLFGFSHCAVSQSGEADYYDKVLGDIGAAAEHTDLLADVIIHVHGNPVQTRLNLDDLRDRHPKLSRVHRVYEIDQQNCSSLFWGLGASERLLAAHKAKQVLVLAGDLMSLTPLSERYAAGCTLVGDATFAMLLDAESGGLQIENLTMKSNPEFYFGRFGSALDTRSFNEAHTRLVRSALETIEYQYVSSNEPLLPHNVNRLSWNAFCKETGVGSEMVWLDLLPSVGHCYTTDPFLMLRRFVEDREVSSAVLLSVALGGFVGACRIRKTGASIQ